MLSTLGRRLSTHIADANPWTNVVGLARTLLAVGMLLTLVFNDTGDLFVRVSGSPEPPICEGLMRAGLFCLLPRQHLELGRWICAALLAVAATGYRPRVLGVVQWFVTLSFQMGVSSLDGGDQVTLVVTLLLLPLTLTDPRRFHWDRYTPDPKDRWIQYKKLFAVTSLWLVRFQVAGIYFHAAAGKYATTEWSNGTALYYWFSHPLYGVPMWIRPVLMPILRSPLVAPLTWSVILLEFCLMGGLFAPKRYWRYFLAAGLLFHVLIALFQGLISFGFAMSAALLICYRPSEEEISFRRLAEVREAVLRRVRAARRGRPQLESTD